MYIVQLDEQVQNLILAVAEQELRYHGFTGNELSEALDNVQCEKVANVVDELTDFVRNFESRMKRSQK